jgi:hypothetical protein
MAKAETLVQTFVRRTIGAALLNASAYEEIEADRTATGQAMLMVLLSSVAAGIGLERWGAGASQAVFFFTSTSIIALLVWAAWALLTTQIGTRLLPTAETQSDVGELLRTLGFASAPGLIRVLAVLPGARIPIFVLSSVWMLAAMVVAVRQALDYTSTARAIAVCGIGWMLSLVLAFIFGSTLLGA